MSIRALFECDGCDAKATGERMERKFRSLNGKGHGFGSYEYPQIQDYAPPGWVAFDPWTGCCYCPQCWGGIKQPVGSEQTA